MTEAVEKEKKRAKKPQRQQGERKRHPQLGPTPSNGQTRRKSGMGRGREEEG